MSIVITLSNLKKNYGNHEVLKGVDLSIEKGEATCRDSCFEETYL